MKVTTVCAENVSGHVELRERVRKLGSPRPGVWTLKTTLVLENVSERSIKGPLSVAYDNLGAHVSLPGASGITECAPSDSPYITIDVGNDNVLAPGERVRAKVKYTMLRRTGVSAKRRVLGGPGLE